jgi:arsenite methyltransferase
MGTMRKRVLRAAFGRPSGLAGRLGGAVMARGNAEQERRAAELASPGPGATVVAVGHGPGVGLVPLAEAVSPGGRVVGVDPSASMRAAAARRCAGLLREGTLELRDGGAEHTGCPDASADAVVSVNNVMLWDRAAGLAEVFRVLRPGGRLVIIVHRHVLEVSPEELGEEVEAAGFEEVEVTTRDRRRYGPAIELLALRPGTA